MEFSYEKQLFDLRKVFETEAVEMKKQRSSDVEELQENIRAVSLECLDFCKNNTLWNKVQKPKLDVYRIVKVGRHSFENREVRIIEKKQTKDCLCEGKRLQFSKLIILGKDQSSVQDRVK